MKKKVKLNNVEVELTKEQLEDALKEFDEPEYDYPICCKGRRSGVVVLFTGEGRTTGTCLDAGGDRTSQKGESCTGWIPHTDEDVWEEIPYDRERGLYHKQPVYTWDDDNYYSALYGFYNAVHRRLFAVNGKPLGAIYENYSSEIPEHMKEFKEK